MYRPRRFTPGEGAPGIYWIGGWSGPRAGRNDTEKWKLLARLGLELRPFRRSVCSQSLYRLCFRASYFLSVKNVIIYWRQNFSWDYVYYMFIKSAGTT
jgi:hypothetical protein